MDFLSALSGAGAADKKATADRAAGKAALTTGANDPGKTRAASQNESESRSSAPRTRDEFPAEAIDADTEQTIDASGQPAAARNDAQSADVDAQQSTATAQNSQASSAAPGSLSGEPVTSQNSGVAATSANLLESLASQPSVAAPVSSQQVELKPIVGQPVIASSSPAAQLLQLVGTSTPKTPDGSMQAADSDTPDVPTPKIAVPSGHVTSASVTTKSITGQLIDPAAVPGIGSQAQVAMQSVVDATQHRDVANELPNAPQVRQASAASNGGIKSALVMGASSTTEDSPSTVNPATARAEHVNASVRIDNASAAEMLMHAAARSHAHGSSDIPAANSPVHGRESVLTPSWMITTSSAQESEFSAQVTRGLGAMMNQRGGVMNMRLSPPELGELRVQMTFSRGVISAEFQASTAQAHSLLERTMTTLRTALESQGLTVDRLNVHAMTQTTHQQPMRDESSGQWTSSHDRSGHDAANGESRGRHEHAQDGAERRHRHADFAGMFDDLHFGGAMDESAVTNAGS